MVLSQRSCHHGVLCVFLLAKKVISRKCIVMQRPDRLVEAPLLKLFNRPDRNL